MKKHIKTSMKAFCFLLFCILPLTSFAQGGTTGPLTWQLNGNTLTISGNGAMPDYELQTMPWYNYNAYIHKVVIENGVTSIGNCAFWDGGFGLQYLISVEIPNSVNRIGRNAFCGCVSLPTINIPNGVTNIEVAAFAGCSSLSEITIPSGVTNIDPLAFADSGLTSITIPESVKYLGMSAFFQCVNLKIVNFNAIDCAYTYFIGGDFEPIFYLSPITTFNIGNSVQKIPTLLCVDAPITTITIPNSVKSIGRSAFSYCINLQTVNYNAINCAPILDFDFGGGLLPVFYESDKLTKINIGNSVQNIPDRLFYGCTHLSSITTYAKTPPAIIGFNAFFQVPAYIPVNVPCGTKQSYLNTSGWNYFTNFIGNEPDGLCMISVDEHNHNEIIWKKNTKVDSYNIYREGNQSGEYDLVATFDYNEPNRWIDTESNAKIRSYRYKIAGIGGGGDCDSVLSSAHKTMHLTINAGQGNSWNLIWTAYEGTEYATYNIYRAWGDTLGELSLIGTMPAGNTSFSDFYTPPGYVYYMVEIVLNETCNTSKAGSSIKSNIASNNPGVGISKNETSGVAVYPNPTTGELRIENGELRIENVEVFDIYGRKQKAESRKGEKENGEMVMDISELAVGVYFVKIYTESGEVVKKVVKM